MKRAGVFVFYHKEGKVEKDIRYYINALKEIIEDLYVIINGKIDSEGLEFFNSINVNAVIRDNVGYDTYAYKHGLETIGYDNFKNYDQLVLANSSLFGPFFPLEDMFAEMNEKQVDFWGIHRRQQDRRMLGYGQKKTPFGYIPEFVCTNFMVFNKNVASSDVFSEYWQNIPEINNFYDAVNNHESIFTKVLCDAGGFIYDTYDNYDEYAGYAQSANAQMPLFFIKHEKMPFFRIKSLHENYELKIKGSANEDIGRVVDYVKDNTDYDVNLIYDNILENSNMHDLYINMNFNYILPEKNITGKKHSDAKIALIMNVVNPDKFENTAKYLKSLPKGTEAYLFAQKHINEIKNIAEKIENVTFNIYLSKKRKKVVTKIMNSGYNYICYMHDDVYDKALDKYASDAYAKRVFENMLYSADYVENIIYTFDKNERLGMVSPTDALCGNFYGRTSKYIWNKAYKRVKRQLKRLGINLPVERNKPAVVSGYGMFWIRPESIQGLKDSNFNLFDSTKSNSRYIYPHAVQNQLYYPGYVSLDKYAKHDTNAYKGVFGVYQSFFERRVIRYRIRAFYGFVRHGFDSVPLQVAKMDNRQFMKVLKSKVFRRASKKKY